LGIVLDSTVLIRGERETATVTQVLQKVQSIFGDAEMSLSAMSAAELVHGIWRARTPETRARREEFVEEVFARVPVRSISLRIARIAGQIDAQARAHGTTIPTADLLIGATALELGFAVATSNPRHFRLIPGLQVHHLE
jgi:predicted nucleic acid-binding protein